MTIKKFNFFKILLFLFFIVNFMLFPSETNGNGLLNEGIDLFRQELYKQAVISFRDILINPDLNQYYSDAYFWISKSYMVLGNLKDAEANLEYYLIHFQNHKDYPEAMYQKGRLLFMQNEYENAIQALTDYLKKYPDSVFQSNALFWIGESLFILGKLDDALPVFKKIVQDYPASFKYEAAKYRISIIEFKKRENELLKLLKWSHLESIKSMEEFQKKERTYEQAISSYQKKIAILDNSVESSIATRIAQKDEQINALKNENDLLKAKLTALEASLNTLSPADITTQTGSTTENSTQTTPAPSESKQKELNQRLLKVKAAALDLKELLLGLLEKNLENQ